MYIISLFNITIVILWSLLSCMGSGSVKNIKFGVNEIERNQVFQLPYQSLGRVTESSIIIDQDVDLNEGECLLPKGLKLVFRDAILKNGTWVGNNNSIECNGAAFDNICIKGDWNVSEIRSSFFLDAHKINVLRNVFALANPTIKNLIRIEKGVYPLRAFAEGDSCLNVCSNSDVIIKGNIVLNPNDFKRYDIICVSGENITISGKGQIIGDVLTHTGSRGEWGMGIRIADSKNIIIQGLTIRDCWGDCIYIGKESKNVNILNCKLVHGRRQGISITSADGVVIKKCTITDIAGTPPEFGIDIEPNKGRIVDNILIEKVKIRNCIGGILAYGEAENSKIGKLVVRNCYVEGVSEPALSFMKCNSVSMNNNTAIQTSGKRAVFCKDIRAVKMEDNTLRCHTNLFTLKDKMYTIIECDSMQIKNNKNKRL